jgi:hypothetical protein
MSCNKGEDRRFCINPNMILPHASLHVQCVPNTRKLRNAADRISSYSALSLVAPTSCSQSVTEEIKVDVGVTFLRAQFNSLSFSL